METQTLNEKPLLMSISEAVRILGVSRYMVERAVENGTFGKREFEGKNYIVRADVEAFVEGIKN